jgi:hypothetical protein
MAIKTELKSVAKLKLVYELLKMFWNISLSIAGVVKLGMIGKVGIVGKVGRVIFGIIENAVNDWY